MTSRLFTASWRTLADASTVGSLPVQPVRISRGAPRFWPEAEAFPAVSELMPPGWTFSIKDMERFGRAYRRGLHTIGLPRIRALLDAIDADGRPLALACFETDPADCHRGPLGFAGWWERKTGELVPDLSLIRARQSGAVALVYEVEPATTYLANQNSNIGPDAQKPRICRTDGQDTSGRLRPDGPAQLQFAAEGLSVGRSPRA
jgi:hypothetical protein